MPYYDYKCPNCGTEFERYFTYDDYKPDTTCPGCSESAHRIIHPSPVKYGQGFFHHMSWGKKDDIIVSTPSGTHRRRWNQVHAE